MNKHLTVRTRQTAEREKKPRQRTGAPRGMNHSSWQGDKGLKHVITQLLLWICHCRLNVEFYACVCVCVCREKEGDAKFSHLDEGHLCGKKDGLIRPLWDGGVFVSDDVLVKIILSWCRQRRERSRERGAGRERGRETKTKRRREREAQRHARRKKKGRTWREILTSAYHSPWGCAAADVSCYINCIIVSRRIFYPLPIECSISVRESMFIACKCASGSNWIPLWANECRLISIWIRTRVHVLEGVLAHVSTNTPVC